MPHPDLARYNSMPVESFTNHEGKIINRRPIIRCFLSASKGHLTPGALENGRISLLFSSNYAETSALGAWLTARQADCHRELLAR